MLYKIFLWNLSGQSRFVISESFGRIIFCMDSCKNIKKSVSFTSSTMCCSLLARWNATWQSLVDKAYYKWREFFFLVLKLPR
jgi:hypothetical protein